MEKAAKKKYSDRIWAKLRQNKTNQVGIDSVLQCYVKFSHWYGLPIATGTWDCSKQAFFQLDQ